MLSRQCLLITLSDMTHDNIEIIQPLADDRTPLLPGRRHTPLHHLWLGIRRSHFFLLAYLFFYVAYLSLGALVFVTMEQPAELRHRLEYRNLLDEFIRKHPSISGRSESKQSC